MQVLIFLNYQREIPPFMLTEINFAAKTYDKVIYITRELINNNSDLITENNVTVIQVKRTDRIRSLLELIPLFFRKEVQTELWTGIKHLKLPRNYFSYLGKELYCTQNLFQEVYPIIKRNNFENNQITIQSTWYDVSAYAVARIKQKFSAVHAISFAHSFEIDPAKGNFVGFSQDEYKLEKLDHIYFIAKGMEKIYLNALPDWIVPNRNKLSERYLGSVRYFPAESIDNRSLDQKFTLCSCSGITNVKRINLIIDALSLWNGRDIEWIHIGDGPLRHDIEDYALTKLKNKKNITYKFIGQLENKNVQKYYTDHFINLFINVSSSEGLPVSIMEAMSYGIPVIATDVGAAKEIVNYSKNMLMPKNITGEDVVKKIEGFINLPIRDQEELRIESMKIWEKSFNAESTAKEYYNSLREKYGK